MPGSEGDVDHAANGFNPTDILTDFDYGRISTLPNGQTFREYDVFAAVKMVEILPGIQYEAWTYNGRVPGPTFRCTEGDHVRINFTNGTGHPHTMHFHGIHPGSMDGVYEQVLPGGRFVYEFDAEPFGLHLYHCHIFPLAEHIARGLYGTFIIDPKGGRPKADREIVMVMSGTDLDFDSQNDVYAVNFIPFHFDRHPIKIKIGELVRVYLVNLLEFDPGQFIPSACQFLQLLSDWDQPDANRIHGYHCADASTARYPGISLQISRQIHVPRAQNRVRGTGLDGPVRGGGVTMEATLHPPTRGSRLALLFAVPVILLAVVIGLFLFTSGAGLNVIPAAPIETVQFERTVLRPGVIELHLRNNSPQTVELAQVIINDAVWPFAATPGKNLPRLGEAIITLKYPWTKASAYDIAVFSSNSIAFRTQIPIAAETATASTGNIAEFHSHRFICRRDPDSAWNVVVSRAQTNRRAWADIPDGDHCRPPGLSWHRRR